MVTERFGAALRAGVRMVADGADCTEGAVVVGVLMLRARVLGVLVAELPGVTDRDAAAALVGSEIWVARSALPPPAP